MSLSIMLVTVNSSLMITTNKVRDMFDINTFATLTFSRLMAEKMVEQAMVISSASPVWRENDSQLKCPPCNDKVCGSGFQIRLGWLIKESM